MRGLGSNETHETRDTRHEQAHDMTRLSYRLQGMAAIIGPKLAQSAGEQAKSPFDDHAVAELVTLARHVRAVRLAPLLLQVAAHLREPSPP